MQSIEQIWPQFGLRIRCGPLELSAVRDDDIPVLVDLVERGIHPPDSMPFAVPWTDAPKAELARNTAVHYWQSRAANSKERWSLELAVRRDGRRRHPGIRRRELSRHAHRGDRVVAGPGAPGTRNRHADAPDDVRVSL